MIFSLTANLCLPLTAKLLKPTIPPTEKCLRLCGSDPEDVDLAVKAARRALKSWRKTSPIERQNYLLKIADIIDQNAEHLALVETLDNGKPIRETSAVDIPMGLTISVISQDASVRRKARRRCLTTIRCLL